MLQSLVLPPGALLALALFGLVVWTRRPRLARWCVTVGVVSLAALSTPLVSSTLMRALVGDQPVFDGDARGAGAIVVLGADVVLDAPEYDGDTLGPLSLERLRYAARVHARTDLPLLTSGGRVTDSEPVGALMAEVLEREFGAAVTWVEPASANTLQNAAKSAATLRETGVDTILLVTHAWHVPRARWCFEQQGLTVVPAGTGFFASPPSWPGALVPTSRALRHASLALHEILGSLWYRATG